MVLFERVLVTANVLGSCVVLEHDFLADNGLPKEPDEGWGELEGHFGHTFTASRQMACSRKTTHTRL